MQIMPSAQFIPPGPSEIVIILLIVGIWAVVILTVARFMIMIKRRRD